jgi:quercetin dioxygenase-like cupin family protein
MEKVSVTKHKKYYLGIDDSKVPVTIGYFEKARDRMHYHKETYETYLVAKGSLTLKTDKGEVILKEGDICCFYPGEHHAVITHTKDLKCFLVKYPRDLDDKVELD